MSYDAKDPRWKALVEHVELFHGLDPADVYKIFAAGMTQRVQPKDTIFFKKTQGNKMYVVLGGKVGVFDGPKLLDELTTGAVFGEMSLLLNKPRSATVVAMETSNLFVLDEQVFQKLLTKRVAIQILLNLSKIMAQRVANANMKIRELEDR